MVGTKTCPNNIKYIIEIFEIFAQLIKNPWPKPKNPNHMTSSRSRSDIMFVGVNDSQLDANHRSAVKFVEIFIIGFRLEIFLRIWQPIVASSWRSLLTLTIIMSDLERVGFLIGGFLINWPVFHFMYVSILSFDHLSFFSPNWWIIYFSIISIYFCLFHDWPFDHIFFFSLFLPISRSNI